jgi:voltage-gated potassium channel
VFSPYILTTAPMSDCITKMRLQKYNNLVSMLRYGPYLLVRHVWIQLLIIAAMFFTGALIFQHYQGLDWLTALVGSVSTITTIGIYAPNIVNMANSEKIYLVIIFIVSVGAAASLLQGTLTSVVRRELFMKEMDELKAKNMKGHIIICGWNTKAEDIIHELNSSLLRDVPVVIIDDVIDNNPVQDARVSFVKGNASERNMLNRANIAEAKYAIVLAEGNTPVADQKTVLTVLAIEKTNPKITTLAELIDANNEQHLNDAGCKIIVNSSILSSRLLAMSLQSPSTNTIIKELISQYGNEIYNVPVPQRYIGHPFLDTLPELKKSYSSIVIGIYREGKTIVNPPSNEMLKKEDILLVISEEAPTLL